VASHALAIAAASTGNFATVTRGEPRLRIDLDRDKDVPVRVATGGVLGQVRFDREPSRGAGGKRHLVDRARRDLLLDVIAVEMNGRAPVGGDDAIAAHAAGILDLEPTWQGWLNALRLDGVGFVPSGISVQIQRDHGLVFNDQHACADEGSSLPVRISEDVGRLHELELCDAWLRSDIATPVLFWRSVQSSVQMAEGALRQIHDHELSRPRGCNRLLNQPDQA
jgi:hypothetical protein